jgi:hypothetical protein
MPRTFKTASLTKAAKKARLTDSALCEAVEQARKGQAVDLGGGVFKKRLGNNAYRSLILAKCGRRWILSICATTSATVNWMTCACLPKLMLL